MTRGGGLTPSHEHHVLVNLDADNIMADSFPANSEAVLYPLLKHRKYVGGRCVTQRTIAMLNENPLSLTGFALKREFTLEEVARVTGMQDCKMATECQIDMLFVPLAWKAEEEAENLLESVSSLAIRVVEEVEEGTASVVQTTGLIVSAVVWTVGAALLWWVSRIVLNRLARMTHGNTTKMPCQLLELKAGESTWEEGTCGHIQAALDQAKMMGLVGDVKAVKFDEPSIAAAKGAAALRSMKGTNSACFGGVVRKAQNLARGTDCFKGLSGASSEAALPVENKKSEERSTPAVRKDAVKELLEIEGVGPSSTCEVRFLKDDIALKVFCELVSGLTAGGQVLLRAYSCDQPDVVKALTESSSRSLTNL
eukprot:s1586_g14.t1